jgi:hypothetical protein
MAKRKVEKEISVHGVLGYGISLTEAKADAISKIEAAFQEPYDYNPTVLTFPRGENVVVYRTLTGWSYSLMPTHEDIGVQSRVLYGTSYPRDVSKKTVIHAAKRHIAQDYWDDPDTNYGLDLLDTDDTSGIDDQKRYRVFQTKYKEYAARGEFTATQCHYLACQAMDERKVS